MSTPGLFLRLGGCRYHRDGNRFGKNPFHLVTLLDQLELLRILDLQANGPLRAAQRHRLLLEVNLLYIGDEGNLFRLKGSRLLPRLRPFPDRSCRYAGEAHRHPS
jgi:hypothetical protein